MFKNKIARIALIPLTSFLLVANPFDNSNLSVGQCYAEQERSGKLYKIDWTKQSGRKVIVKVVGADKNGNPLEGVDSLIGSDEIPVKLESDYMTFKQRGTSRVESDCVEKTDIMGTAKFWIFGRKFYMGGENNYYWYLDREDLLNDTKRILEFNLNKDFLKRIDVEKINFNERSVKDKVKARILTSEIRRNSDNLFSDETLEFYVEGIGIADNLQPLRNAVRGEIKAEFENKYKTKSLLVRVVGEDLCPLEDAVINFWAVKAPTLEQITNELSVKKNQYIKNPYFREDINFDPSYLISNLDGKEETVSKEGMPFVVNVPSEYDISVIKKGYNAKNKRVKFTEKMEGKMNVKLSPIGQKVGIHFDFWNKSDVEVK